MTSHSPLPRDPTDRRVRERRARVGPGSTINSADDLEQLWRGLLAAAESAERTLWLVFLGFDQVVQADLVPIDGLPATPDPDQVAGPRQVVAPLIEDGLAGSVAMLLSRSDPAPMSEADRVWARALRATLGAELAPWPLFLAAAGEVRIFAPDDLIG